jgi:N-hydroxyarylamine O-acetyltransferase
VDTTAYLTRIRYFKPIKPDAQTLHGLQLAHLRSVSFENLDIGLGRPILLEEEALWNKIVLNGRGGFCYEVNGLFAWLLKEIGYDVTYLNARDYHEEDDTFGIDFDHLTLLVRVPNEPARWLVDVGWGDTFTQPLDIDTTEMAGTGVARLSPGTVQGGLPALAAGIWRRDREAILLRLNRSSLPG